MMCVICCDPEMNLPYCVLITVLRLEDQRICYLHPHCSHQGPEVDERKTSYRFFPSKYNICSSKRNFCDAFINCSVQFIT